MSGILRFPQEHLLYLDVQVYQKSLKLIYQGPEYYPNRGVPIYLDFVRNAVVKLLGYQPPEIQIVNSPFYSTSGRFIAFYEPDTQDLIIFRREILVSDLDSIDPTFFRSRCDKDVFYSVAQGEDLSNERFEIEVSWKSTETGEVKDPIVSKCPSCQQVVVPDLCHCGEFKKDHSVFDFHPFVAMGCDCYRAPKESPSQRLSHTLASLVDQSLITKVDQSLITKARDGLQAIGNALTQAIRSFPPCRRCGYPCMLHGDIRRGEALAVAAYFYNQTVVMPRFPTPVSQGFIRRQGELRVEEDGFDTWRREIDGTAIPSRFALLEMT